MPYVVTQSCCADASCVVACPVNCIHPAPGEPGFGSADMVHIDPAGCVGCGACVTACPVGAIAPHTRLTPTQQPFEALNAEYYEVFPHTDRAPVAVVAPQRRLQQPGPFRVAVIGSGPAGMYTADELLKHPEVERVDVIERLRTPYGLVRYGVAPDHRRTKRVTELFTKIDTQPRFRYRLGVEVGTDVTLEQLRREYDAVVYAVGAPVDRRLGVPGEDLRGSLAATDVVRWYNGHPDLAGLDVPLDHERVVVVGNGNVALDLARILTIDPESLTDTDISPEALAALRTSRVREVVLLGRRGPAQAAFTVPELIGLKGLADRGLVDVVVEPTEPTGADLTPVPDTAHEPGAATRARLLTELAARPNDPAAGRRRIVLRFGVSPVELTGTERVEGVRAVRNRLEQTPDGRVRAVPTERAESIDAGLVIRSIGHRGLPVPGLPFDLDTGTVPNERGRVEPGVYVAGWIKRGPTGFIGTNKPCAQETVECILDDLDHSGPAPSAHRSGRGSAPAAARVPAAVGA